MGLLLLSSDEQHFCHCRRELFPDRWDPGTGQVRGRVGECNPSPMSLLGQRQPRLTRAAYLLHG